MRIAGVTLPENKRMEIALTAVYGVGRSRARQILNRAGISLAVRPKNLTVQEENAIRRLIDNFKVEGELKREVSTNIKRFIDIGCYRGIRHVRKLPVRGQRTRTNSRTRRGNIRKTMGSGRKKLEKK